MTVAHDPSIYSALSGRAKQRSRRLPHFSQHDLSTVTGTGTASRPAQHFVADWNRFLIARGLRGRRSVSSEWLRVHRHDGLRHRPRRARMRRGSLTPRVRANGLSYLTILRWTTLSGVDEQLMPRSERVISQKTRVTSDESPPGNDREPARRIFRLRPPLRRDPSCLSVGLRKLGLSRPHTARLPPPPNCSIRRAR